MEKIDIITEVIQRAFSGKIKAGEEVNVRETARAILEKLEFHSTMCEVNVYHVKEAKMRLFEAIDKIDSDMDNEISQMGPDETLLKNFAMGQKTACEKFKEIVQMI